MVSTVGTSFIVMPPAWSALGDLTAHPPIFAMGEWVTPLPSNMPLPPISGMSGMAQLFADGAPLSGVRPSPPRLAMADGDPSAPDAAKPRFSTPLEAKMYVEYGWALYWRVQGDGIGEGLIREIRGIAQSDIDLLVSSWEGREPFAYDAVFGFALAGHRYARQKFVEGLLKKVRAMGDESVKIIIENIEHSLRRVWTTRDEEEHYNMYYAVRGLVLTLCSMASDGDKGALGAVNFYLAVLFELAGQLRGQPDPGGRVSRAFSDADTFLKEANYLLSEVSPDKFLDEPIANRDELDLLARHGNMRVLETFARYAVHGDAPAVITALNTALAGSNPAIFDLLMDAARENPCILLIMLEGKGSDLRKFFAEVYEYVKGMAGDGSSPAREIHAHIIHRLKSFDFAGVSFDCENPAHMFETTILMAFLGNRSAIGLAVELTERMIANGFASRFEDSGAGFLRAHLNYIVEASRDGCADADELIRNLATLGHEGARQHVANGMKPGKKLD